MFVIATALAEVWRAYVWPLLSPLREDERICPLPAEPSETRGNAPTTGMVDVRATTRTAWPLDSPRRRIQTCAARHYPAQAVGRDCLVLGILPAIAAFLQA
jgi:hypothetical protein